MTYFFETYGCQMNTAESAALKLAAEEAGWTRAETPENADLVLINTCAVRETAERRARGRLALYNAAKKKGGRPFTLVAAGCMASRLGEALKASCPGLDFVMGARARAVFPVILSLVERNGPGAPLPSSLLEETPAFAFSPFHIEGESPLRSFVPVSHGCGNFCSYCIVPYVRGPEVPRSPEAILKEIALAAEKGVREITLLGQNVNSYRWEGGGEGGSRALDFPGLLERVAEAVEGGPIRWVRFLSSHPKDLSERAIKVMASRRCFCRHIHLPVQHGSNAILEKMNRRYTRERYLDLAASLREALPGLSLSTDILVGFPGETASDHEETLSLMEAVRFLYAYTYHYNPREGTAAFSMPGRVGEELKRERLGEVIALQKRHTREALEARVGQKAEALIEGISRRNADNVVARTERDEMAAAPGGAEMIGRFGIVTLSSLRGNTFVSKEIEIC